MALIHLAECEPDPGKGWEEMTYLQAQRAGGRLCPDTVYMENELYTSETVFVDPAGRFGHWMQTVTGRAFWPLDPHVDDVDPEDIAHALSMLCRFGGHVSAFYSVAEHCVLMSEAVAPEDALWALLHDATEAYLGDMIRPLKLAMPAYVQVENRLMEVICHRFGLPLQCPPTVKEADTRILRDERDALKTAPPLPWVVLENVPALGVPIGGWDPAYAKRRYLDRLTELTGVSYLGKEN
jgi:hypothetical protein